MLEPIPRNMIQATRFCGATFKLLAASNQDPDHNSSPKNICCSKKPSTSNIAGNMQLRTECVTLSKLRAAAIYSTFMIAPGGTGPAAVKQSCCAGGSGKVLQAWSAFTPTAILAN